MKKFAAVLLLALAPYSQAKETTGAKTQSRLDELQQGISQPQDFENFVEGSRSLAALQQGPGTGVPSQAAGAFRHAPPLNPTPREFAPETGALPPAPFVARQRPARKQKSSDVPFQGQAALLGMAGALLIAASFYQGKPRVVPAARRAPNFFQEPESFAPRLQPAPSAAPQIESMEPAPSFIDTRMPARTWRAISLREQQLIEDWNSSREKALGQASLEQWLDARATAAGVDAEILKTKLNRDA